MNEKTKQKVGVTSLSSPEDVKQWYNTNGLTWSENYILDDEGYSYNPAVLRLNVVKKLIEKYDCDNIFDAGCADGPVMLDLLSQGKKVRGVDFSEELIVKGKEWFRTEGYDDSLLNVGDVTNIDCPDNTYDAVICLGVLPHIENMEDGIRELVRICKPGAKLILSFRNDLFDLFTFNRFTLEFYEEHFFSKIDCSPEVIESAKSSIRGMISNPDVPEPCFTDGKDKTFGNLTRINSNPLTIGDELKGLGVTHLENAFYKFHPFPPLMEAKIPGYRELGAKMDEKLAFSWEGNFMCSTFIGVFEKN